MLIKPAGPDCSLACHYCYYLDKSALFPGTAHRMSEAVLRNTVRQMMQQGGQRINFAWQGGEPTLMGLRFYETAVHYQSRCSRPGQQAGNGLQTNGLHIDEHWARFLHQNSFLVGLSLDGPEQVHDRYRRFRSGEGSWRRVVKSRDLLLSAGVAVNALIVVNDNSVHFPEEIYNFHKQSGIDHLQFIPCLERDDSRPGGRAAFSVDAEAYGRFLVALFDLWRADFSGGRPTLFIRWFDSLFYTYLGLKAPECTLLPECGVYLVVEHNGEVFACDFYVDEQHRLGNVSEARLADLLNSPAQEQFGAAKRALPDQCTVCPWLTHCWCGCPRERIFRPDGVNYLCPAWRAFFEYADPHFRALAGRLIQENRAGAGRLPQSGA